MIKIKKIVYEKNIIYLRGLQGPTGTPHGAIPTVIFGATGLTGLKGPTGPPGITGPIGDTGAPGVQLLSGDEAFNNNSSYIFTNATGTSLSYGITNGTFSLSYGGISGEIGSVSRNGNTISISGAIPGEYYCSKLNFRVANPQGSAVSFDTIHYINGVTYYVGKNTISGNLSIPISYDIIIPISTNPTDYSVQIWNSLSSGQTLNATYAENVVYKV